MRLEAKLSLAVGARVMLRRNLDTKSGLVNGAMGTVLSITSQHVTVQFDHITQPCNIEMVKSKFMVMKNYYVYRKQFPLILAYAITIHKCQGLSLDCAIIDLSENVFSDGMAYVALSRVRSLSGLHLVAFHPKSIMVSINSLQETNRLRKQNTKLPLYSLPTQSKPNRKRKLTSINDQPEPKKPTPCIKILKTTTKPKQKKRALSTINVDCDSLAKKSLSHYGNDYNPRDEQVWPFKFYSVDCNKTPIDIVVNNPYDGFSTIIMLWIQNINLPTLKGSKRNFLINVFEKHVMYVRTCIIHKIYCGSTIEFMKVTFPMLFL